MYPNARYQDQEGDTDLEKFTAWITAGHTNAAYCEKGSAYCSIEPIPAYCENGIPYCEGAEGDDQATCELNNGTWVTQFNNSERCVLAQGTWVPEVPRPPSQAICEANEGEWITEFPTEESCSIANGTWHPEEVIEKVPFTDSHSYTGDMRIRKLEELNQAVQVYIYTKYDIGTQASLQAIDTRPTTPQVVRDQLNLLFEWIAGVMNYYYGKKDDIIAATDYNSITWDFSQFDATDPNISLKDYMGPS